MNLQATTKITVNKSRNEIKLSHKNSQSKGGQYKRETKHRTNKMGKNSKMVDLNANIPNVTLNTNGLTI